MANNWTEHKTKEGRVYYYNKVTKESTWTKPPDYNEDSTPNSTKIVWEERYDPKTKRMYYFDRAARKSTWEKPKNAIIKSYVSLDLAKEKSVTEKKSEETEVKTESNAESNISSASNETESEIKSGLKEKESVQVVKKDTQATAKVDISTGHSVNDSVAEVNQGLENIDNQDIKNNKDSLKEEKNALNDSDEVDISKVDSAKEPPSKADTTDDQLERKTSDTYLQILQKKDSIMEADVISTIEKFLRDKNNTSGPELLVETLPTSYRGYAQMTCLMAKWLDSIQPSKNEVDSTVATILNKEKLEKDSWPSSDTLLYNHIKSLILQKYDPKKLKHVLDAATEPPWLKNMLSDSKWRLLLIELADKNKSCGVLNYAVQRISEAGHHKEIASVTSASTYFSVFNGVVLDALQRVPHGSVEEVSEDIASLKKICSQNAYTYMYTQEILRNLDAHAFSGLSGNGGGVRSEGQSTLRAARKFRRVQQELQESTYTKCGIKIQAYHLMKRSNLVSAYPEVSSSILNMLTEKKCGSECAATLRKMYSMDSPPPVIYLRDPSVLKFLVDALFNPADSLSSQRKEDCIFVLAYAVCATDNRNVYDYQKSREKFELNDIEETKQAIKQASDLCKSDHTLGFNMNQSGVVEELSILMDVPVVSMGVMHWIHVAMNDSSFYNGSLFHVCFPSFLRLIRKSVDAHPLQWQSNFSILVESLKLHTDLNPVKALELKRNILHAMVHMMTRGYVLPVLHFVIKSTAELDQALLRNFVTYVMERIKPAYSKEFAMTLTTLLTNSRVLNALSTSPNETKKKLLSFIKYCRQQTSFLSKPQQQALKGLKSILQ